LNGLDGLERVDAARVSVWPDQGHLALVRQFLPGVELDLRAGRQPFIRPWEVVGELAAAIHSLDVEVFAGLLPSRSRIPGNLRLARAASMRL
jgi:hypothetical protein